MTTDRSSLRAWLPRIALVAISVALLVFALVWWQDRPLVRAEAFLRAGEPDQALATLDGLLARRPDHQRALLLEARALVALQRWGEAARIFGRTGAGTADELRAWATALLHQRQWREALPLLEQLSAGGGQDAEILRDLTICRYQLGQAEAALESATELARLPGHARDGLFHRGVIHRSLGNTHLAIEAWEQIEELAPHASGLSIPPAEFFRVFAEDLMFEARPRQAAVYFQRSLELQPSVEVRAQLGEAWYWAGRHDEAQSVWTDVLQQDEQNAAARMGLAELALSRADGDAALRWLAPIAMPQEVTADSAYLMQRAHTLLGHEQLADDWQQQVSLLRKSEKLQAAFAERSGDDE